MTLPAKYWQQLSYKSTLKRPTPLYLYLASYPLTNRMLSFRISLLLAAVCVLSHISAAGKVTLKRKRSIHELTRDQLMMEYQQESLRIQTKYQRSRDNSDKGDNVMENDQYNLQYTGPISIGTPAQTFQVSHLVVM